MSLHTKTLFFLIFLLTSVSFASNALALITGWPPSPFGTNLDDNSTLTDMVKYFYEWGVSLGGIAVFIALVIGGFLYLTSAGDPERLKEAKDRIFSALTGFIFLLCIYLILRTINPQLTILIPPDLLSTEAMKCDCASNTIPCPDCKNADFLRCEGDPNPGDGNKEGSCRLIVSEYASCTSDKECQDKFGEDFICDPDKKICVQKGGETILCDTLDDCPEGYEDCVGGDPNTTSTKEGICVNVEQ